MSELTFKEALEELVKETKEAEEKLPEGMSVAKYVVEFKDILGYQVVITIGKDIIEEESDEEEHADDY